MLTLCTAMGIQLGRDPDKTYELTTDNVKKMLAVYMRFKCEIPVLIMGETGCGKTRLIQFMCALQATEAERISSTAFENIVIMKIHGGTTTRDIIEKVTQAEKIAEKNAKDFPTLFTVLFLMRLTLQRLLEQSKRSCVTKHLVVNRLNCTRI
ncbi:RNF213 [Mytilus edulis]|uniref:RNF213 n=1 Tax=Mytilus edulis TaxID=6550 RepID=A0A8S3QIE7_MYTED|nr:RNF213 [Mytilus edulis]